MGINSVAAESFPSSTEVLEEVMAEDGTSIFSESNLFVWTSDNVGSVVSVWELVNGSFPIDSSTGLWILARDDSEDGEVSFVGINLVAAELIPSNETSPSSESSIAKLHNPVEESIEKESLINSQTDNTEHTLSEVRTNKLDLEKIDVPSSAINSSNISVEEGKDSAATELMPTKEISPTSELSLVKSNDKNQGSFP